jgi:hypothetical protein
LAIVEEGVLSNHLEVLVQVIMAKRVLKSLVLIWILEETL